MCFLLLIPLIWPLASGQRGVPGIWHIMYYILGPDLGAFFWQNDILLLSSFLYWHLCPCNLSSLCCVTRPHLNKQIILLADIAFTCISFYICIDIENDENNDGTCPYSVQSSSYRVTRPHLNKWSTNIVLTATLNNAMMHLCIYRW